MIDPIKHDLEKVACVSLPTHPIFTKSLPSPQSMSRCQKLCLFLQLVQNPPNQNRPQKFSTQTAILSSHCQKQVKLWHNYSSFKILITQREREKLCLPILCVSQTQAWLWYISGDESDAGIWFLSWDCRINGREYFEVILYSIRSIQRIFWTQHSGHMPNSVAQCMVMSTLTMRMQHISLVKWFLSKITSTQYTEETRNKTCSVWWWLTYLTIAKMCI
jgi:hypothetical protein